MESIIARQKIGKRRSASRFVPTSGAGERRRIGGHPASSIALQRIGGVYSPGGARFPGLPARLALLVLRSIARVRPRPSRIKPAIGIGAGLAILSLAAFVATTLAKGPSFPMPASGLVYDDGSLQNLLLEYVSPELADGRSDAVQDGSGLPPVPATLELSTYTVRSEDSLATIARRFGLDMGTIISVNGISSASSLRPGAQLRIPNIDGLIQKVRAGDSISSISKRYKVDATKIVDANDLGSARLIVGQSLFVPGAKLPDSEVKRALGERFAWPVRGPLSSPFGYRPDPFTGVRRFHAGIDIAVDAGTTVRAAMDGKVADVGYNGNFGNYVILSHADGYQTLYGHLTKATVTVGTMLSQGSALGLSGNTGYSTGPHLHFGLFHRSLALNPLKYLK